MPPNQPADSLGTPSGTPAPAPPVGRAPGRMSTAHRVLGVLYALGLAGFSSIAAVLAVFALSPTACPSASQQFLCDNPQWQGQGSALVILGLAASVVVAVVAACVRTTRVGLVLQSVSVILVVLTAIGVALILG